MKKTLETIIDGVGAKVSAYLAIAGGIVTTCTKELPTVEAGVLTAGGLVLAAVVHYVENLKKSA